MLLLIEYSLYYIWGAKVHNYSDLTKEINNFNIFVQKSFCFKKNIYLCTQNSSNQ